MTKNVIFDSYALIAHFRNEPGAEEISSLFAAIAQGNLEGFISQINIDEVYYMLHRKSSSTNAEKSLEKIKILPIEAVGVDWPLIYQAAKLKAGYKISYADAFAAALTIQKKGTLVTGDPEFRNLKKEKDFKVHFINR